MTQKTQESRRDPASIGPRAEQSGGDALQQPKRLGSHGSVDHHRCGNIQHTAKQAAPENGEQSIRVRRRQCSGRRVHEFLYGRVYKRISRRQEKKKWPAAGHLSAAETRLRVNVLTHCGKKNAYDHQKVCRGGRRCARLCAARRNTCLATPGVAHVLSLLSPLRWLP